MKYGQIFKAWQQVSKIKNFGLEEGISINQLWKMTFVTINVEIYIYIFTYTLILVSVIDNFFSPISPLKIIGQLNCKTFKIPILLL